MTGAIHYEVFLKKNRKVDWALYEACPERDPAIRLAHSLLAEFKDGSVRVMKEKFDGGERKFRGAPIFEGGAETHQNIEKKTGEANLPCYAPDDLAKPHARETIRRCLDGWLERNQALPMELLHRPDLVESLEASGTELQHAIQKVAVASAQSAEADVQGVMKQLNELVQGALERIYQDGRNDKLASFPKNTSLTKIATEIHDNDPRPYQLRAALADQLKSAKKYGDKLEVLLDMSDALPEQEDVREFAREEVDQYLSEVIAFDAGRDALLGKCDDLGETAIRLTCLFDGDDGADELSLAPRASKRLAQKIREGDLDACRSTVAQTLLTELGKPKRLRPTSIKQEVQLARELAHKLTLASNSLLPPQDLQKVFSIRSARLLSSDAIDELLKHADDINEELGRLLSLEDNIVGEPNKQKLASYVRGILGQHAAEAFYVRGPGKPLERLALLTNHQQKVRGSKFPEKDRIELSQTIDRLGMKVIDESKILNMVEAGDRPALDKATALLRLATAGALPLGECSQDAQARALRHLKSTTGLGEASSEDGKGKLRMIQSMLKQLAERMPAA